MFFDIVLFNLIASLTRQNHQLTNHIRTTEVDTWVWLRITLFLCSANRLREGHISSNLVEDEVQRTTQDSLNLQNLVT